MVNKKQLNPQIRSPPGEATRGSQEAEPSGGCRPGTAMFRKGLAGSKPLGTTQNRSVGVGPNILGIEIPRFRIFGSKKKMTFQCASVDQLVCQGELIPPSARRVDALCRLALLAWVSCVQNSRSE